MSDLQALLVVLLWSILCGAIGAALALAGVRRAERRLAAKHKGRQ